jgi:hypothetical protein
MPAEEAGLRMDFSFYRPHKSGILEVSHFPAF